jgi:hypothetical protein
VATWERHQRDSRPLALILLERHALEVREDPYDGVFAPHSKLRAAVTPERHSAEWPLGARAPPSQSRLR